MSRGRGGDFALCCSWSKVENARNSENLQMLLLLAILLSFDIFAGQARFRRVDSVLFLLCPSARKSFSQVVVSSAEYLIRFDSTVLTAIQRAVVPGNISPHRQLHNISASIWGSALIDWCLAMVATRTDNVNWHCRGCPTEGQLISLGLVCC